jgi:nicotinate-nucleotide adenylyltransferase
VIGLLGGSFDPVHHGHLLVAQAAREVLGLSVVRFVPARAQPLKDGHEAAASHRAEMVRLAIDGAPGFELDRQELERPGPSYTVDTLRALRRHAPAEELVLLVGGDAVPALPAWRDAADLPALARIVAFARAGAARPASDLVSAWIDVPAIEISATAIRARVREGRSIRYWVPDAVVSYIARHGLYRDGAG